MTKFLHGFFSFGWLQGLDFLPPLLFRFFLAPILWIEGSSRLGLFKNADTIWWNPMTWFDSATYQQGVETLSNAQGLMPIPFPSIMNGVIGGVEVVAAFLLIIGLAVRWISIPLLAIIVIIGLATVNFGGDIVNTGKDLFMSHGYSTPTNSAFATTLTLFLMVLALFFMGAGRFFSMDWFIHWHFMRKLKKENNNAYQNDDPFDIDSTETS